jgi:hypothetical protein
VSTNFPAIAADALAQARNLGRSDGERQALILANILPRLMVPAMKQVSGYEQQPRIYTHPNAMTAAAAAGSTDQETISWTANADFLWTTLSVVSGVNGNTAFNFHLQITFGGNDRNLCNRAAGFHPFGIMGTDRIPFLLPKAFVLRKRDTANLNIVNLDGTEITNCFVYFIGIDYFDANVLDGTRRVL